jgi:microcystin-dependent protein
MAWARKGSNDAPIGVVNPFAGATAPSNWLLCDGSSLSTTTYANLFAVIAYAYGGSGANFSLPDLRGRAIAGKDNMGGTAASRLTATVLTAANTLGATGGTETHSLTIAQLATHTHVQDAHGHSNSGQMFNGATGAGFVMGSSGGSGLGGPSQWGVNNTTATNQNTGSGTAHQNTQPTIILNYIIRAA